MQSSSVVYGSPSFTSHSSNNLPDVAARVVQEFHDENGDDDYDDIFNFNDCEYDNSRLISVPAEDEVDANTTPPEKLKEKEEEDCDTDDDHEFEFAVVCRDVNSSSISADEVFSHGHMLPRYPLFDRSLLLDVDPNLIKVVDGPANNDSKPSPVVRRPLRKLFLEERDSASCSSSEADDLDGVKPGTYCVWKPKAESPGRCKKSNSISNTSRRWKFRDILYRSNSDGKEKPFLIFKPLMTANKKINNEKAKKVDKSAKVAAAVGDGASEEKDPASKSENGGGRRRSYLPYNQDLVGAFANVNGLSRNLRPF